MGTAGLFKWPPNMVSYLPPDGEEGDAVILKWVQSCRIHKDGGGWTEIPTKALTKPKVAPASHRSQKKPKAKAEPSRLFGDAASEEDLARWGVNLSSMPGLTSTKKDDGGLD